MKNHYQRVREIMEENKMDVCRESLVLDMTIMYLNAQKDLLKEQLEENAQKRQNKDN